MLSEKPIFIEIDSDAEEDNYVTENLEEAANLDNLELDKLFKVQLKLGQTPICATEKDQTQTLLVKVSENTIDEEKISQASLDLVCVIDCSGSMNGFKLTQVQQTLVYLMEMLQPTDRLAIVAFNSQAVILNSLRLVTKENKCGRLLSNIQSLTAVGGTNIVCGLKKAYQILSQRTTKNRMASVFLLSDGNDNFDLVGLNPLIKLYKDQNYSINTFGYGDDHDPDSLRKMAEDNRGSFYFIKDLSRIDEAFVDCLALLCSAIGGKAKIVIKLVPTPTFREISFKQCYGSAWRGDEDTIRHIDLGYVYIGMDKTFVSEIALDCDRLEGLPADVMIAEAILEMKPLTSGDSMYVKDVIKCQVVEKQQDVVKDVEVEKHLLRVTGATVLTTAREFLNKGNVEEAEKVFEMFKSRLGKVSVNDVVLQNLTKQAVMSQQYFNNFKNPQPQQKVQYQKESRSFAHCLNQQAAAFMNEQSAPEWNQDMYQNNRQKRFIGNLAKYK